MPTCEKCGNKIKSGRLCQTCAKYKRNGGVWHPIPAFGTVAYDDDGKPICHMCGMAMDKLIEHTKKKHGLDTEAYREAFGLMRKNARLTSPQYSDKMREHVDDKPTWKENFKGVHSRVIPNGRRKNPHWSQQEIDLRRNQQSLISKKRWENERRMADEDVH